MPRKQKVPEDLIRQRSYEIWENEGYPVGHALEHWFQAKAELESALFSYPRPYDESGHDLLPKTSSSPPKQVVSRSKSRKRKRGKRS